MNFVSLNIQIRIGRKNRMSKREAGQLEKTLGNTMSEFKKFILKGNIIDMAVGVIIGGAFSKIVTSLVNDILMPALGAVTGGASFSDSLRKLYPEYR